MIYTMNGREVGRAPTRADVLRPLYMLVDLAMVPAEKNMARGVYTLDVDWIRILHGRPYPGPVN
jgi:hypothetical protein